MRKDADLSCRLLENHAAAVKAVLGATEADVSLNEEEQELFKSSIEGSILGLQPRAK
jgi:hypothetical protein